MGDFLIWLVLDSASGDLTYIGSYSEGYFFIPYFPSPLLGLHAESSSEGTLTMSGNK